MPKDYAKKATPKRRKRRGKNKPAPGWMWLTAGLTVGLFIAGIYFLSSHDRHHLADIVKTNPAAAHATKPNKPAQPEFDFYTMLPASQAPVVNAGPGQAPAPRTNNKYILQVASVKEYTDADRLKAELTLLGFNVFIQKYQTGQVTWNRVNIGPYASLQQAATDQNRLRQNNINSILLKSK